MKDNYKIWQEVEMRTGKTWTSQGRFLTPFGILSAQIGFAILLGIAAYLLLPIIPIIGDFVVIHAR